ncbi:acyl carrier protein [Streptomyces sp. URMC 123]|uniref:acyl carrier protein n=1 Tax=Streptomyces sp. URMC 123 TaxID=3423403 RepID=UPI003F1BA929
MDVEAEIKEQLTGHFGVDEEQVRPEATLAELGMDSLAFMELLVILEQRAGVAVAEHLSDINPSTTLAETVSRLETVLAAAHGATRTAAGHGTGKAPTGAPAREARGGRLGGAP